MCPLSTIEAVGIFVRPLSWGIGSRIVDLRLFAVVARVDGVVRVEEEGRGRGKEHPSANTLATPASTKPSTYP